MYGQLEIQFRAFLTTLHGSESSPSRSGSFVLGEKLKGDR